MCMEGKGSQQILQDVLGGTYLVPCPVSSARKPTLCLCWGSSVNHWLPLCCQSLMYQEGTSLWPGYKPYDLRSLGTITSEDPPLVEGIRLGQGRRQVIADQFRHCEFGLRLGRRNFFTGKLSTTRLVHF